MRTWLMMILFFTMLAAAILTVQTMSVIAMPTGTEDPKSDSTPNAPQDNTVIDVMILFTPQAAQSVSGIQDRISQAVAEGNQAFQNSNIPAQLRVVYVGEYSGISDSSSKIYTTYLNELDNDQFVAGLREQYRADLVQLVVSGIWGNVWGGSYSGSWPSVALASHINSPYFSLVHEFGHNIGELHAPIGYDMHDGNLCDAGQPICTVMAKNKSNALATRREARFSEANAGFISQGVAEVARFQETRCFSTQTLFCDVPDTHWAHADIAAMYDRRITTGCDSSKTPYQDLPFCPSEKVDRAHFAVFLIRRIHDDNPGYTPSWPYQGYFTDVPSGHPQALWIEELYRRGLTTGSTSCPGQGLRFCPDNILERQELASFLMRTERYLGNIPDYSTRPIRNYFGDVPSDSVHIRAIEYMFMSGYTNGCYENNDDGIIYFCPFAPVDRATAAVFMARIFLYRSIQALDPLEPDNSYARPSSIESSFVQTHQDSVTPLYLAIGTSVTQARSITPIGDREWVQFSLPAESGVRIGTSGLSGDTRLWLYDADLNELAFDDDNGVGNFSQITRSCSADSLPAGTYFLLIDEFGNNQDIPSYTLELEATENCQPNAPLSGIFADTLDASLNSKTVFQRGETIWLATTIINASGTSLETVWDWRVTDSGGAEVDSMGLRDSPENLDPGPVRIRIRDTVPQTLAAGSYTFIGSVRTTDGQFSLQASTQFDVVGPQSSTQIFLPMVRR